MNLILILYNFKAGLNLQSDRRRNTNVDVLCMQDKCRNPFEEEFYCAVDNSSRFFFLTLNALSVVLEI